MSIYTYYTKAIQNKKNELLSLIDISLVKPTSVHFSITSRCNLSCRQCDIWKSDEKKELSSEDIKKSILSLKKWIGPFLLNFAGGEPFLRKDMIDIIRFCTKHRIKTSVTTNGILIDRNLAKQILDSGLTNISISLDSLNPIVHDYLRNKRGTFEKVYKAIQYLNVTKRELCIVLATVIMEYNIESLPKMALWVKKNDLNGLNLQPIFNNFGSPYRKKWFIDNELWPKDYQRVKLIFNKLIQGRKNGSKVVNSVKQLQLIKEYFKNPNRYSHLKCKAGIKNFALNESGDALLCFWLPAIGNIVQDKPQKIWKSPRAEQRRKQINRCTRNCKLLNCHFD